MKREVLKGAMSRLGKHRRMTANKALRRANPERYEMLGRA